MDYDNNNFPNNNSKFINIRINDILSSIPDDVVKDNNVPRWIRMLMRLFRGVCHEMVLLINHFKKLEELDIRCSRNEHGINKLKKEKEEIKAEMNKWKVHLNVQEENSQRNSFVVHGNPYDDEEEEEEVNTKQLSLKSIDSIQRNRMTAMGELTCNKNGEVRGYCGVIYILQKSCFLSGGRIAISKIWLRLCKATLKC